MTSSPPTRPLNPFTSPRLVYRAVRDTPEDEAFVHAIQADAEAQSGACYGLLRPESLKSSNEFREHIASKCLLGAIICLPAAAAAPEAHVKGEQESPPAVQQKPAEAGTPIGIICLKSNPPHLAHHRWTDVSIDIHADHRGKGYGGEAIEWGLWYSFQMAGLHRVQIQAFGFNEGAVKLYTKLGFREEGRQRDFMWFNGGWHDNVIFGMLEHEWRARRDGEKK
ncbi:GNAT family acetyltransferase [Microdochium bolleyi]|uniref:GNAT family acetyltransferase n=1 Tax=Microdochium bolleyi TaxID=196109 RepID=A0A136JBA8_9PEZI|nr:GNAT family acetyltransferase [Microdochium bolleyi]